MVFQKWQNLHCIQYNTTHGKQALLCPRPLRGCDYKWLVHYTSSNVQQPFQFYLLLIVRLHFTSAIITRSLLHGARYMALNPSYAPYPSGSELQTHIIIKHSPHVARSLISLQGPKLSSCGQRRLWSDWADVQPEMPWLDRRTSFCWFCLAQDHMYNKQPLAVRHLAGVKTRLLRGCRPTSALKYANVSSGIFVN